MAYQIFAGAISGVAMMVAVGLAYFFQMLGESFGEHYKPGTVKAYAVAIGLSAALGTVATLPTRGGGTVDNYGWHEDENTEIEAKPEPYRLFACAAVFAFINLSIGINRSR